MALDSHAQQRLDSLKATLAAGRSNAQSRFSTVTASPVVDDDLRATLNRIREHMRQPEMAEADGEYVTAGHGLPRSLKANFIS